MNGRNEWMNDASPTNTYKLRPPWRSYSCSDVTEERQEWRKSTEKGDTGKTNFSKLTILLKPALPRAISKRQMLKDRLKQSQGELEYWINVLIDQGQHKTNIKIAALTAASYWAHRAVHWGRTTISTDSWTSELWLACQYPQHWYPFPARNMDLNGGGQPGN